MTSGKMRRELELRRMAERSGHFTRGIIWSPWENDRDVPLANQRLEDVESRDPKVLGLRYAEKGVSECPVSVQ